jgi:hypothetical protein
MLTGFCLSRRFWIRECGEPALTMTRSSGLIDIPGRYAGRDLLAPVSGRLVVGVFIGVVILVVLLAIPVLWDNLMDGFSKQAAKVAPKVFLVGAGILLAGLVIGVSVIDFVGACMMGAVVLAAILDNY